MAGNQQGSSNQNGGVDENAIMAAIRKMFGGGGGAPGNPKGGQGPNSRSPANNPNNPESMEGGLDVFANLFNNEPGEGETQAPRFAINAETLTKAAGSLDFTKSLPPDLMEKIKAGDGAAMFEAMQHIGRTAYQTAIQHTTGVADRYIESRLTYENDHVMPKRMREMLAMQNVAGENAEMLDNPVVKSHLKLITSNLAKQYPDADPKWLGDKAKAYFLDMAKAINPNAFTSANGDKGGSGGGKGNEQAETDWGAWLGTEEGGTGSKTNSNAQLGEIPS